MAGKICSYFSSLFFIVCLLIDIDVKQSESQLIYNTQSDKENCDLRERMRKVEEENIRLRQVNQLNRIGIVVSFSVTAENDEKLTIKGPNEIIVFKNVLSNVGDGYNPTTGIFTAPVTGNYVFFFAVEVPKNTYFSINLFVNNNFVAEALAGKIGDSFNTGSNMVSLLVRKNDRVCIKSHPVKSRTMDIRYTANSFSGFLLSLA
ncbi:complement C1q-like protein 3 [Saccostrea echinata]|uniref:complement C1q-like protein 3 n=1 Tax=Saccostrea echinata TaxID=191078 RepID=UPI002A838F39|nr:complement C1q-like protein 3 [Saccostrea echinata]